MTIVDGHFNLFVVDQTEVDRRDMNYQMTLETVEGTRYYLSGQKIITRSSLLELWPQTNTLYAQIRASDVADAPVIGKATLIITPENFLRQMRTIEVTHTPDLATRLEWTLKFGKFFGGVLFTEYGGVAAPLQFLDSEDTSAPRVKRTLRAPAPELNWFNTSGADGKTLKLTRYHAGNKGPVLLVHGSGTSSRIFSTDLIPRKSVSAISLLPFVSAQLKNFLAAAVPAAFPVHYVPSNLSFLGYRFQTGGRLARKRERGVPCVWRPRCAATVSDSVTSRGRRRHSGSPRQPM